MSGPGIPAAGATVVPPSFPAGLFGSERIAVLGLGRNGLPAALALRAMGAAVSAWDDGEAARAEAARAGLDVREPDVAALDAMVLSPGIPHRLPAPHPLAAEAMAAGVPVLSDAELLFRAVRRAGSRARFAGITGTNGKSTTTALLAHLLHAAGVPAVAGGNLGPAALALPLLPDHGVYVLEMSSYMLERLERLRFDAACLLNLSPDHLDRHGDMRGYVAAKREVFARQEEGDLAVLGVDDPDTRALSPGPRARVLRVSGEGVADVGVKDGVLCDALGPILSLREAPALPGAHNAQDAAAAVALALHLGVPRAGIAAALRSFPGLPHRQSRVAEADGIVFIDDSKATNADAAARALACHERLVWIAGGVSKAEGIEPLRPLFGRVAHAVLVGRDAPRLAATLRGSGVPHTLAGTLEAAVPLALRLAREGGAPVVLLSPACASFDQFSGFEARGERFAALARALAAHDAAPGEAA